jgi:hypothetical protein
MHVGLSIFLGLLSTRTVSIFFLLLQLQTLICVEHIPGRGKVTYIEEGSSEQSSLEVQRGDVYNFEQGTVLHIRSHPNATRQHLRIYALFSSEAINADDPRVRM